MNRPSDAEKPTARDIAYRTTRAALSAIPGVGGAVVELFQSIVEEPVQKRRVEWLEQIFDGLTRLEQRVDALELDRLGENEEFVSVLMTASQIAQRNHQAEKLAALRHAVLNSALAIDIEADLKFMFLSFIDDMTATELKIVQVCGFPMEYAQRHNLATAPHKKRNFILHHAFPERVEKKAVYDLFARNLHARGLLDVDHLTLAGDSSAAAKKVTTPLGDEFLRFVKNPVE